MAWANQYGITTPVLEDEGSALYWRFGTGGLPQAALLGPGAEVLKRTSKLLLSEQQT